MSSFTVTGPLTQMTTTLSTGTIDYTNAALTLALASGTAIAIGSNSSLDIAKAFGMVDGQEFDLLVARVKTLEAEIKLQRAFNASLQAKLDQLWFAPGMPGAQEAADHFQQQTNSSV